MEASGSYPMKGGAGPGSYVNNSDSQREAADYAFKAVVTAAIIENLDTAILHRHQMEGHDDNIEFQCFFSDHVSNDFNTLFLSLPTDRRYFVAGVPGSFYFRLFRRASINFFSSTYALHWLSCVPKELTDLNSLACNKGRITYANARNEVVEAFAAQFAKDTQTFLHARAEETVQGGLVSILMSGRPDGMQPSKSLYGPLFQPLESCLEDMANEGLVNKDELDKFNIPLYSPSATEISLLVQRNGKFSIAKLESLHREYLTIPSAAASRAGLEGILSKAFGNEIVDELYDRYTKRVAGISRITGEEGLAVQLFFLLKRNY